MTTMRISSKRLVSLMVFSLFMISLTTLGITANLQSASENEHHFGVAQGYEPHATIWTEGNQELLDLAAADGWDGTGTVEDPFIITGYSFYATLIQPVRIWYTDLHWIFTGNYITTDGVICGAWFQQVTGGSIVNNTFDTCHSGLVIYDVENLIVEENTFLNNTGNGVENAGYLINCTIRNNEFVNLGGDGIVIDECEDVDIYGNTIVGMDADGIDVKEGITDVNIFDNTITDVRTGYRLGGNSYGVTFENNLIFNVVTTGIRCIGDSNTITDNTIWNVGIEGILFISNLGDSPDNNTVKGNTFINCTQYAIEIKLDCTQTRITGNDFFDGNSTCQICDHASDSTIESNFYDRWTSPDVDEDGIVDEPYEVTGSAQNNDPTPIAEPINAIPDEYDYVPYTPESSGFPELTIGTMALIAGIGVVACIVVVVFVKTR